MYFTPSSTIFFLYLLIYSILKCDTFTIYDVP
jgi:hypothetical protein